jgi:hypothetical protein
LQQPSIRNSFPECVNEERNGGLLKDWKNLKLGFVSPKIAEGVSTLIYHLKEG